MTKKSGAAAAASPCPEKRLLMWRGPAKTRIQRRPAIAERIHPPFQRGSLSCSQFREENFLLLSRLGQYFSRGGNGERTAPALYAVKAPASVDRRDKHLVFDRACLRQYPPMLQTLTRPLSADQKKLRSLQGQKSRLFTKAEIITQKRTGPHSSGVQAAQTAARLEIRVFSRRGECVYLVVFSRETAFPGIKNEGIADKASAAG